jgi:hypothetical protein
VEVTDETMIRKAKGNPFFKVDDAQTVQWREPATEADPADDPAVAEMLRVMDEFSPPDYPPEDEPKRKRGRPPNKVKADGL